MRQRIVNLLVFAYVGVTIALVILSFFDDDDGGDDRDRGVDPDRPQTDGLRVPNFDLVNA